MNYAKFDDKNLAVICAGKVRDSPARALVTLREGG